MGFSTVYGSSEEAAVTRFQSLEGIFGFFNPPPNRCGKMPREIGFNP
ncbi:hypothetical protein CKA32_000660 [Geitlerinema sp. FC II]|nr:hypothetical protein CKA32_000660 [Geitlerinema sp. FC II]